MSYVTATELAYQIHEKLCGQAQALEPYRDEIVADLRRLGMSVLAEALDNADPDELTQVVREMEKAFGLGDVRPLRISEWTLGGGNHDCVRLAPSREPVRWPLSFRLDMADRQPFSLPPSAFRLLNAPDCASLRIQEIAQDGRGLAVMGELIQAGGWSGIECSAVFPARLRVERAGAVLAERALNFSASAGMRSPLVQEPVITPSAVQRPALATAAALADLRITEHESRRSRLVITATLELNAAVPSHSGFTAKTGGQAVRLQYRPIKAFRIWRRLRREGIRHSRGALKSASVLITGAGGLIEQHALCRQGKPSPPSAFSAFDRANQAFWRALIKDESSLSMLSAIRRDMTEAFLLMPGGLDGQGPGKGAALSALIALCLMMGDDLASLLPLAKPDAVQVMPEYRLLCALLRPSGILIDTQVQGALSAVGYVLMRHMPAHFRLTGLPGESSTEQVERYFYQAALAFGDERLLGRHLKGRRLSEKTLRAIAPQLVQRSASPITAALFASANQQHRELLHAYTLSSTACYEQYYARYEASLPRESPSSLRMETLLQKPCYTQREAKAIYDFGAEHGSDDIAFFAGHLARMETPLWPETMTVRALLPGGKGREAFLDCASFPDSEARYHFLQEPPSSLVAAHSRAELPLDLLSFPYPIPPPPKASARLRDILGEARFEAYLQAYCGALMQGPIPAGFFRDNPLGEALFGRLSRQPDPEAALDALLPHAADLSPGALNRLCLDVCAIRPKRDHLLQLLSAIKGPAPCMTALVDALLQVDEDGIAEDDPLFERHATALATALTGSNGSVIALEPLAEAIEVHLQQLHAVSRAQLMYMIGLYRQYDRPTRTPALVGLCSDAVGLGDPQLLDALLSLLQAALQRDLESSRLPDDFEASFLRYGALIESANASRAGLHSLLQRMLTKPHHPVYLRFLAQFLRMQRDQGSSALLFEFILYARHRAGQPIAEADSERLIRFYREDQLISSRTERMLGLVGAQLEDETLHHYVWIYSQREQRLWIEDVPYEAFIKLPGVPVFADEKQGDYITVLRAPAHKNHMILCEETLHGVERTPLLKRYGQFRWRLDAVKADAVRMQAIGPLHLYGRIATEEHLLDPVLFRHYLQGLLPDGLEEYRHAVSRYIRHGLSGTLDELLAGNDERRREVFEMLFFLADHGDAVRDALDRGAVNRFLSSLDYRAGTQIRAPFWMRMYGDGAAIPASLYEGLASRRKGDVPHAD